jgi:hypothetical protein
VETEISSFPDQVTGPVYQRDARATHVHSSADDGLSEQTVLIAVAMPAFTHSDTALFSGAATVRYSPAHTLPISASIPLRLLCFPVRIAIAPVCL